MPLPPTYPDVGYDTRRTETRQYVPTDDERRLVWGMGEREYGQDSQGPALETGWEWRNKEMKGKDWKKAMEEAGFPHMDLVKSAKEGVARSGGEGWAYRVVIVDLEIKLPNGYFSRDTVKVDLELLERMPEPALYLCDEVIKQVKKSLKVAGIEE